MVRHIKRIYKDKDYLQDVQHYHLRNIHFLN